MFVHELSGTKDPTDRYVFGKRLLGTSRTCKKGSEMG